MTACERPRARVRGVQAGAVDRDALLEASRVQARYPLLAHTTQATNYLRLSDAEREGLYALAERLGGVPRALLTGAALNVLGFVHALGAAQRVEGYSAWRARTVLS